MQQKTPINKAIVEKRMNMEFKHYIHACITKMDFSARRFSQECGKDPFRADPDNSPVETKGTGKRIGLSYSPGVNH
jgi:hypothetical protein